MEILRRFWQDFVEIFVRILWDLEENLWRFCGDFVGNSMKIMG